jgi:NAD-dependent deacetylase
MQRIVVLTGAGISAESVLKTFRGTDGLWEAGPERAAGVPGRLACRVGL